MRIGYIGLGALGGALARRLQASSPLTVWDVNPRAVAALVERGAIAASSAAVLARECDVVMLCLPRSEDVHAALFGPQGVAEGLTPGKLVIDQTSGVPARTREMAEVLARRGVAMIDAAVSASPAFAEQGGARLMIAGPDAACAQAMPVLEMLSASIHRCGTRVGDGQAMKTVNNAMNAGCRLGTLEAVAVGRKAGLTLPAMAETLNKSTARNLTTVNMLPALAEGKSSTDFALALMLKDIDQAVSLGMDVGVPMPIIAGVRSLLQIGVNTLAPGARLEDVVGLIESMAGTRIAMPGESAPVAPDASTPASKPVVGYVGVGAMGAPIVRRLLAHYAVHVYDVRPEATRALAEEGAIVAPDLASLARAADVVLTCLPTPAHFREAVLGAGGLAENLAAGKLIVDQTTGMPGETRAIAGALAARGVMLVDAPISGGPQGAADGTLTVMCGGVPEHFAAARRVLEAISPTVLYCGGVGNGHAMKLINNAIAAMCRLITYECITAGYKYGLKLADMAKVLYDSSGWSFASRRVFKTLVEGDRAEAPMHLPVKDFKLAGRLAMECGAPMLLVALASNTMQAAFNESGPQAGTGHLVPFYERIGATRLGR